MTHILPILLSDITKIETRDLIRYLDIRCKQKEEEAEARRRRGMPAETRYDERLSEITTELLRRHDQDKDR